MVDTRRKRQRSTGKSIAKNDGSGAKVEGLGLMFVSAAEDAIRGTAPTAAAAMHRISIDDVVAALRSQLIELTEGGDLLVSSGSAQQIAASVIRRLPLAPVKSKMAAAVGPCYSSASLQRDLDFSRQAISKASIARRVLRLTTADGESVYPAFQVRDGKLINGLKPVLDVLKAGVDDPWAWALWLNGPIVDSDGATTRRIEQLAAGNFELVLRAAKHTAAAWAA